MNELTEKSDAIYDQIMDLKFLSKCLKNSINYSISECDNDFVYLYPLLDIIDDKFKNLTADYDKFDLLLYNFKTL